uniref:Uncharacterized protein n=1 Tax=Arundo donax TaxID=35708 RepID=A0A0A9C775_ARUDO
MLILHFHITIFSCIVVKFSMLNVALYSFRYPIYALIFWKVFFGLLWLWTPGRSVI